MKHLGTAARGMLFNLVFSLWAQLCAGWVARDAKGALDGSLSVGLALVLFIVLALEPLLLKLRFEDLSNRAAAAGLVKWGEAFPFSEGIWVAIAHLVLGPVMVMVANASLFGSPVSGFGIVLVMLSVGREIYLFMLFLSPPTSDQARKMPSPRRRLLVSLGLVSVSCIGFASTWLPIAARGEPINQVGVGGTLLYGTMSGLLFLFFYVPTRVAWLAEESVFAQSGPRLWALRATLVLAVLSALRPLVVIENGQWFMSEAHAKYLAKTRNR